MHNNPSFSSRPRSRYNRGMSGEAKTPWDERLVKRLKLAANEGQIARMISHAVGLAVIVILWVASLDFIWQSLRPPD